MSDKPYILKIGGADLSDYIAYGDMSVTEAPVYNETETSEQMYAEAENTVLFTAVSGKKIYDTPTGDPPENTDAKTKKVKGKSVSISAAARMIPAELAVSLFEALENAEDKNKINIEYAAPVLRSADFEYPSVTSEISVETEDETLYDLSITANCPLIRFDGA